MGRISAASLVAALAAVSALVWLGAPAARADDPFLRRTPTVIAVEKVGPAVVNITTEQVVEQRSPFYQYGGRQDSFFRQFMAPQRRQTVQSLGSGVLIDAERHVLTNEHVVASASRIFVTLNDGREYEAKVIGADPTNDLAVLVVQTDDELPWVPPGSSHDILVGEPVIAIGNPFGFSNTVTTGVVSATDRSIQIGERSFHGFIQTDASINPGNSGGPLLNAEGDLIAINTAIFGSGQGIGFAIPIDAALRVVAELIEHGEVTPVTLGLDFQDLDPALREVMDLPNGVRGVLVNRVDPGGPAAKAGLRRGDVIATLDGTKVEGAREFFSMLETVTVDQSLVIEAFRNDEKMAFTVKAEAIPDDLIGELANRFLGVRLEWKDDRGYAVDSVRRRGPAELVGIRRGDILMVLNGVRLEDEEALKRALMNLRGRPRALAVVQRGSGRYNVAIPLR